MGKVVRPIIGVIAVVAIIFAAKHIHEKRTVSTSGAELEPEYQAAADSGNTARLQELKKEYEALAAKASGQNKKTLEAMAASCGAWTAWHLTSNKPSIRKYEDAIKKMETAKDLTGDEQGVWTKNLADFRRRHKEAMGPDLAKMQADFARLEKQPFGKAMNGLETLWRWRKIWHDQDMYVNDKDREAVFAKVRDVLLTNYCRLFEESIEKARKVKGKSEAALSAKSAPLGTVARVARFDKAKADAYRQQHADDMKAAEKASKELEALMEKMAAEGM